MAVGAGSIKRASKLNAEAAEPKKTAAVKADKQPEVNDNTAEVKETIPEPTEAKETPQATEQTEAKAPTSAKAKTSATKTGTTKSAATKSTAAKPAATKEAAAAKTASSKTSAPKAAKKSTTTSKAVSTKAEPTVNVMVPTPEVMQEVVKIASAHQACRLTEDLPVHLL